MGRYFFAFLGFLAFFGDVFLRWGALTWVPSLLTAVSFAYRCMRTM